MVDHRHKESWWPCQEFTPKARKCRQRWMMMLLPKNPSFDKKRTLSTYVTAAAKELEWESSSLQCILSYFTSQLKRKSLQRRIEVTPASELCMQVHYFLWWQGRVIKRGKSWMLSTFWGGPLQQILFGLLPCPSTNNFMNWIFALMFSLLLFRREIFEKNLVIFSALGNHLPNWISQKIT